MKPLKSIQKRVITSDNSVLHINLSDIMNRENLVGKGGGAA